MDPYCPYGSPLSWIPIVLDPYCPGSLMSWFHFVLDPSCPGSILSWIHLVLDPSCPGSIYIVLVPYCPVSLLSWFHFVLVPFCPGSLPSWFHFVLVPFCPMKTGQRGRPWQGNIRQGHGRWNGIGKEPHFQPMGQKTIKKSDKKIAKKQKIMILGRGWSK